MNIKKLTSLIFNRTVLIAALIVFQAALLLVSMVFFSAFFVYFYWNCVILSILAVLIIVSRQTDPGYKHRLDHPDPHFPGLRLAGVPAVRRQPSFRADAAENAGNGRQDDRGAGAGL